MASSIEGSTQKLEWHICVPWDCVGSPQYSVWPAGVVDTPTQDEQAVEAGKGE